MSWRGSVLFTILLAALAGCTTPRPVPVERSPVAGSSQVDALEEAYRQRASTLTGQQRWAEAAVQWELLALLRPDSMEYPSAVKAARRRSDDAAAAQLRVAEEARKRGDDEQATLAYLRALSADPGNLAAAGGLKAIEIERARRAWLDRPTRIPYAPQGAAAHQVPAYDPSTEESVPRK